MLKGLVAFLGDDFALGFEPRKDELDPFGENALGRS